MKLTWTIYSLLTAVSAAGMVLIFKRLLVMGINQVVLNWAIFGLVFIGFSSMLLISKTSIRVSFVMVLLLIIAGVFSLVANYAQVKAFGAAPNPGFASTLISTQLIFISVLSIFLFNAEFNIIIFFGVVVVIFGAYLVTLYMNKIILLNKIFYE